VALPETHTPNNIPRTPKWVWAVILLLALLQPLVHFYIRYSPPEGTAPTGLHIPDSALFLESMKMFENGFASPYATCKSEVGDESLAFYTVPLLWLYGGVGWIAGVLHADLFLFYGFMNGVGAFLFLWVVYRLLARIFPQGANSAFLLFSLSAGPGGLLYLLCALFGGTSHPLFETYFFRFAVYDLMEGPHFQPALYYPRLYYTLSLAGCLGGLNAVLDGVQHKKHRSAWVWAVPVALGSFINARFAVFVLGLVVLFLLWERRAGLGVTLRALAGYAVPAAVGLFFVALLQRHDRTVMQNLLDTGNMAMWWSPFIVTCWAHLLLAGRPLWKSVQRLPQTGRVAALAGLGYLAAMGLLYVLYQGYHGNLLRGHDAAVAATLSDPSLVGALLGIGYAFGRKPKRQGVQCHDWIALWLIGYTAFSLSGFGGGWFLRFGPQRLQVMLWLPLCLYAALGLKAMSPRPQKALQSTLLLFGITGILTATFVFQAPLGRKNAQGPYGWLHTENMSVHDETLLENLGAGMVLAPLPGGDVAAALKGNPTIFGVGTFNLTDQRYITVRDDVARFFTPDTPQEERHAIAQAWCAEWIYCPDTWPVDPKTLTALQDISWLHRVDTQGRGALFRVED
jgi:hypothetical protein